MSEDLSQYTSRVQRGDDGVYRWHYDMDMIRNRSMLYTLLKANCLILLAVTAAGSLLIAWMEGGFDAPMARGVALIGLMLIPFLSLLYIAGFYIAAWIKRGNYRIRFAMREDGVELVWSDRLKEGMAAGATALRAAGVRGRWRPTLDEVSTMSFSQVLRMKSYPQWDMIDLVIVGGKFQVYVSGEDFDRVELFIRDHVPERARGKRR